MVAYFVDACFYQRSRFCVCNIQHFFTTQGTNQDFMCNIQHFLLPKEQIKILCVISNIFETSGFVEERGFHWVHRSPLCCWQTGRFKTCTKVVRMDPGKCSLAVPEPVPRKPWTDNEVLNAVIGDGLPSTTEVAVRLTQIPLMIFILGALVHQHYLFLQELGTFHGKQNFVQIQKLRYQVAMGW